MAKDRLSGTLAVILHADVAGSTELVHQNEQLAHQRIQDTFHRFGDTIFKYHGHVRELRGDALLAEFERASDAVTAALAFQAGQTDHNAQLNDNIQPTVRVGIAMGEVIIADDTITGTGVVLAQRLEQLSKPGGLVIQGAAYETIPGRFPFEYEDLGRHEVKGFEQPVRVYSASLKSDTDIPQPGPLGHGNRNTIVAIAAVAFIVAGIALMWFKPWEVHEKPAMEERMAFALPDKPSIAVLPFTNMSGDAEQEYFVDGMTEDLITDLSKIAGLFVIARNSSFTYKGKSVKVGQVAEELGVRYVLEGSVRRAGDQVRINAQLIDATSGGHLWAERYDGSLEDIFALQDQVTQQIVIALAVSLTGEETAQQGQHATENAAAHDAFLQGWAHYKLGTPKDLAHGIPHFEEAIRLDPGHSQAHAALASVYWDAYRNDWAFDLGLPSFIADERANQHLELALQAPTPLAHAQQALVYLSLGFPNEAVREAQMAVDLDGNDATAHAALANALVLADRPREGVESIRRAMRLDPHHPPNYLITLGAALFGQENYSEAAVTFERAVKRNPADERPLIYLASSYSHLGRMLKAEDTIEAANDLRATFGEGALSLEKAVDDGYSPFTGEIDFPSFGSTNAQNRLRKGLSNIPALTWQYLVKVHYVLNEGANTWSEAQGATLIDLATAKALYDRGALFIDTSIENDGQRKIGWVSGSVHLPLVERNPAKKRLRETTLSKIADKTDELVFYWCAPGNFCAPTTAIAKTINWGYQNVYYFTGGIQAWKEAGYPIETNG